MHFCPTADTHERPAGGFGYRVCEVKIGAMTTHLGMISFGPKHEGAAVGLKSTTMSHHPRSFDTWRGSLLTSDLRRSFVEMSMCKKLSMKLIPMLKCNERCRACSGKWMVHAVPTCTCMRRSLKSGGIGGGIGGVQVVRNIEAAFHVHQPKNGKGKGEWMRPTVLYIQ